VKERQKNFQKLGEKGGAEAMDIMERKTPDGNMAMGMIKRFPTASG